MFKNLQMSLFYILLTSFNICAEEVGYFVNSKEVGYLGISNMNKEFKINSLMNSSFANDVKATKIFLASGENVNEKNIAGVSPLHLASRNNSLEVAEILILNAARLNEQDNEGWTPFMRASLGGNLDVMKLLMANKANIWLINSNGETALLHTAMANCYECGKLILEDKNTKNYKDLIFNQKKQALQIVNKRYNEEFIELLGGNIMNDKIVNTTFEDNKKNEARPSDIISGNIILINEKDGIEEINEKEKNIEEIQTIFYNFTGKTISKEELNKNTNDIYKSYKKMDKTSNKDKKIYIIKDNKKPIINEVAPIKKIYIIKETSLNNTDIPVAPIFNVKAKVIEKENLKEAKKNKDIVKYNINNVSTLTKTPIEEDKKSLNNTDIPVSPIFNVKAKVIEKENLKETKKNKDIVKYNINNVSTLTKTPIEKDKKSLNNTDIPVSPIFNVKAKVLEKEDIKNKKIKIENKTYKLNENKNIKYSLRNLKETDNNSNKKPIKYKLSNGK